MEPREPQEEEDDEVDENELEEENKLEEERDPENYSDIEDCVKNSDEETDSKADKGGANARNTTGDNTKFGKEDDGNKSRGIIDAMNDYLESIFSAEEEHDEEIEEELTAMYCLLWRILSATVGVIAIVVALTKYPQYLNTLHENKLWFSNIKEVEREISFRTEQGLYYSYYKQMAETPSWTEGYNQLLRDNATEHGRTINIVHRFNILPEIVLSLMYRWLSPEEVPSMFYVSSVFMLHGVYAATLYTIAWFLSDSVFAGMIAVILFVVHRIDTTRVNYAIPLRESFAVPLLFLQILVICMYIRSSKWQKMKLSAITLLTVLFLLSWQFGPFILLCQLFCVMLLGRLLLLPTSKVIMMVGVVGVSLVVNCGVQANPPLLVSSPALSMVVPALIISFTPSDGSLGAFLRLTIAAAELSLMVLATVLLSGGIKVFMNIDADSHIYQLLLAKFQMGDPQDFDSQLYMCNEAFDYMDFDTMQRLCDSGLLLMYFLGILMYTVSTLKSFISIASEDMNMETFDNEKSDAFGYSATSTEMFVCESYCEQTEPEIVGNVADEREKYEEIRYGEDGNTVMESEGETLLKTPRESVPSFLHSSMEHHIIKGKPDLMLFIVISVVWSVLAALILRLKVLWMPTACIIAGVVIADNKMYSSLMQILRGWVTHIPQWLPGCCKMVICLSYIAYLSQKYWGQLSSEIWPEEVYEFWDPDTVELMEWIQSYTPPSAVFAGSMQLLAAVKLCTGRHITNHPHYEDSWLRHRTHQVYKMYGSEAPEVVHMALWTTGATHIILEDSICLAPPDAKHPLCRLTDIVDLQNGHMPAGEVKGMPVLQKPQHRRFCDAVRHKIKEYSRFFSLVMSNKTFRVYRLAKI